MRCALCNEGLKYKEKKYMQIHDTAFIAPGAVVLGDVTIGENSGIWYNAVVRGDRDSIVIGKESNIQDNAVVHLGSGYPVEIGDHVTIGHGAIVHGCKIGDNTMIGMGAILMNGCKIGKNCIIGAGALVTQNVEIPDNSLVVGNPGKVKRAVTEEEIRWNLENARIYVEEAQEEKEHCPSGSALLQTPCPVPVPVFPDIAPAYPGWHNRSREKSGRSCPSRPVPGLTFRHGILR